MSLPVVSAAVMPLTLPFRSTCKQRRVAQGAREGSWWAVMGTLSALHTAASGSVLPVVHREYYCTTTSIPSPSSSSTCTVVVLGVLPLYWSAALLLPLALRQLELELGRRDSESDSP